MNPQQRPITGSEDRSNLSPALQALVGFYHAFNTGDMHEMSLNWAQTQDVSMDNPLGGIKRGWSEIQEVYQRIFHGPAEVYVEFYDYTLHEANGFFYVVGRERGQVRVDSKLLDLAIRTSRLYQSIDGRYQQVHHHGSIEDPALLAEYQAMVRGGK